MGDIKDVELDDGDMLRIRRKGRLNGMFIPVASNGLSAPLFELMPKLSSSALRMLCGLLQDTNDEVVTYVEITPTSRVDLASLELNKVLRRLSAAQWPRRKGHTTVVLSPEMIRTRDERVLKLWCNSGLSTKQEELQPRAGAFHG